MNIIKLFVIILTVVITLCAAGLKPKMHKHFILVSPTFKLTNNNQIPKDMQSVFLFKTGEAKTQQQKVVHSVESEQNDYYTQRKTKIIPSSFFTDKDENSYVVSTSELSDSKEFSQQKVDLSSDNAKAWAELEKSIYEQKEAYNKNKNDKNKKSDSFANEVSDYDNFNSGDLSCPICDELHNTDYEKDELIAWNIWRSNLQNKIMDDSDIDASYGSIFYFTFKVDNNRNISDIKVFCTDFTNQEAIEDVRRAIVHLNGHPILKFPKNTSRNSTIFKGGFIISTHTQYSSPSDFNDYERIRMRY